MMISSFLLFFIGLLNVQPAALQACEKCKYVVPVKGDWIDGEKLELEPGDTICLDGARLYNVPLRFKNIRGTEEHPITIINCNGVANITVPSNLVYGVKFEYSEH